MVEAAPERGLLAVLQEELPAGRGRLTALTATVIIVNRNGSRYLHSCLASILSQELEGGYEVIVVDNGSSDGSAALIADAFPTVTAIEEGRNLGFARANNHAIRRSQSEYLVLLNNDTVASPGLLSALCAAARSDGRVGAVQAKLVYRDRPGVIQSAGTLLLDDGSGGDRGSGEPDDGRYGSREEVFAACAAAVLYRRAALEDAGLFDESFFMYYEDTDLSWRLRLRGWRVLYEPAAIVQHVHAATAGDSSRLMRFHADRNRLLMLVKNAPVSFLLRSYRNLGARATSSGAGAREHERTRVLLSFLRLLPRALLSRLVIRARRRVPDAQVLRWAVPRNQWDGRTGC